MSGPNHNQAEVARCRRLVAELRRAVDRGSLYGSVPCDDLDKILDRYDEARGEVSS